MKLHTLKHKSRS